MWDAHADWRWRGLWLRGLYADSHVDDADLLNEALGLTGEDGVGSRQQGWYLQAAFDVLSLRAGARSALFPFVRYERFDTQSCFCPDCRHIWQTALTRPATHAPDA
mgnify:CR=1 FL=1